MLMNSNEIFENICKKIDIPKEKEELKKAFFILNDLSKSIELRTRALFILRNIICPLSAELICLLLDKEKYNNILIKHEMAYVLGQMKQKNSINCLINNLLNEKQDPITRHECAEALGNFSNEDLNLYFINKKSIKNILKDLINHPIKIISESCILAVGKLNSNGSDYISPFYSYDPTLPSKEYNDLFLNDEANLYERYKIMFYLRNLNNDFSINKLSEAFKSKSDLLRHELGFVMGQMKNEKCLNILESIVMNNNEKDIVRHEAIEAIGSIGTEKGFKILERFKNHEVKILRESALVGLDITSEDFFNI